MRLPSLFLILLLLLILPFSVSAETLSLDELAGAEDAILFEESVSFSTALSESAARAEMIDRIIATAESLFNKAAGRAQRAQYSGDIYVCKNFSVHIFRENCDDFRMAQYPDVPLVIPNNQKKDDCAPYVYGVEWQDVSAEEGNPFYAAASFRYDDKLSKDENRRLAREFLMQVQRGDYFQMAAN